MCLFLELHVGDKVKLEPNDRLVLLTDGVSDNLNPVEISGVVSSAPTPMAALTSLGKLLEEKRSKNIGQRDGSFRRDDATAVVRYFG